MSYTLIGIYVVCIIACIVCFADGIKSIKDEKRWEGIFKMVVCLTVGILFFNLTVHEIRVLDNQSKGYVVQHEEILGGFDPYE